MFAVISEGQFFFPSAWFSSGGSGVCAHLHRALRAAQVKEKTPVLMLLWWAQHTAKKINTGEGWYMAIDSKVIYYFKEINVSSHYTCCSVSLHLQPSHEEV